MKKKFTRLPPPPFFFLSWNKLSGTIWNGQDIKIQLNCKHVSIKIITQDSETSKMYRIIDGEHSKTRSVPCNAYMYTIFLFKF
jgi:hypothetical protein